MSDLFACTKCFKKPQCKVIAKVPRYINNFTVHKDHEILRCGFCSDEIPCPFCRRLGTDDMKCDKCGMVMKKIRYPRHRRMHLNERPFGCARCLDRFKDKSHLIKHLRTHTGEQPYKCDACGKVFSQDASLMLHKRTIHSNNMPFECVKCIKRFKTHNHLNQHMHRAHQARYPPCAECGQIFFRRCDLVDHMSKHHHVSDVIDEVAKESYPFDPNITFDWTSESEEEPMIE